MVKEIRQNTAFLTFRLHVFFRTKLHIENMEFNSEEDVKPK